jgi:hypothetical protein
VTRDDELRHVLDSIDGALADTDMPDAMRWSPEPEQVTDAGDLPFDGRIVPQPPQHYERPGSRPGFRGGAIPLHVDDVAWRDPLVRGRMIPPSLRGDLVITAPLAAAVAAEYEGVRARLQGNGLSADAIASVRQAAREAGRREPAALREVLLLQAMHDPEALDRTITGIVDVFRPVAVELGRIFTEFGRAISEALPKFQGLQQQLVEAGVSPEQPPSDPRARALWLRQHRNTGPAQRRAQHAHAPRWHDGRR